MTKIWALLFLIALWTPQAFGVGGEGHGGRATQLARIALFQEGLTQIEKFNELTSPNYRLNVVQMREMAKKMKIRFLERGDFHPLFHWISSHEVLVNLTKWKNTNSAQKKSALVNLTLYSLNIQNGEEHSIYGSTKSMSRSIEMIGVARQYHQYLVGSDPTFGRSRVLRQMQSAINETLVLPVKGESLLLNGMEKDAINYFRAQVIIVRNSVINFEEKRIPVIFSLIMREYLSVAGISEEEDYSISSAYHRRIKQWMKDKEEEALKKKKAKKRDYNLGWQCVSLHQTPSEGIFLRETSLGGENPFETYSKNVLRSVRRQHLKRQRDSHWLTSEVETQLKRSSAKVFEAFLPETSTPKFYYLHPISLPELPQTLLYRGSEVSRGIENTKADFLLEIIPSLSKTAPLGNAVILIGEDSYPLRCELRKNLVKRTPLSNGMERLEVDPSENPSFRLIIIR